MNDIVQPLLGVCKDPFPIGVCASDGKRPDGMSIVPWISRKLLVWDATSSVTYTLSNLNNRIAITGAGAAAEESVAAKDIQIFTSGLDLRVYSCGK